MEYEVYVLNKEVPVCSFESEWQFSNGETVFLFEEGKGKRAFIIGLITHDLDNGRRHTIRLNCQEKKVFN